MRRSFAEMPSSAPMLTSKGREERKRGGVRSEVREDMRATCVLARSLARRAGNEEKGLITCHRRDLKNMGVLRNTYRNFLYKGEVPRTQVCQVFETVVAVAQLAGTV
jgi:hypothetical protein